MNISVDAEVGTARRRKSKESKEGNYGCSERRHEISGVLEKRTQRIKSNRGRLKTTAKGKKIEINVI